MTSMMGGCFTGHITIENFSIVGREDQNLKRAIKEALFIRVNNLSLNRNIGKFHLPHIWDELLFNTSELKLKYTQRLFYLPMKHNNTKHTTLLWLFHLPLGK